jgi:Uncharacterized protein involved in exopolysaccharide biosynthesis
MTSPSSTVFRIPRTLGWICVALLILGAAAIAVLSLSPKRYFAAATIVVYEDVSSHSSPDRTNPQSTESQVNHLQKREILFPVIDRLDLQKVLAKGSQPLSEEDAYASLLRSMDLRVLGEPGLIQIGVYSRDPVMAANIANTIALVYREKRYGLAEATLQRVISNLEADLRKKTKDVEQAAVEPARLRVLYGLTDPDPEHFDAKVTREDQSVGDETSAAQRKKEYREYMDEKSRYIQSRKYMVIAQENLDAERAYKPPEIVTMRERAEPPKDPVRAWWRCGL